jgi:hypothetical protein
MRYGLPGATRSKLIEVNISAWKGEKLPKETFYPKQIVAKLRQIKVLIGDGNGVPRRLQARRLSSNRPQARQINLSPFGALVRI